MLLNYHISCFDLSSLCDGDLVRLGLRGARVAGFSLQPRLQAAARTLLQLNRTQSPTHSKPRTKQPMW